LRANAPCGKSGHPKAGFGSSPEIGFYVAKIHTALQ